MLIIWVAIFTNYKMKSKKIEDKLIYDYIKIKYLSLPYFNDKTELISIKIQKLIKQ